MREVGVTRTERDEAVEIAFRFKATEQLLDPDDRSPLPAQELTEFAEEFIASRLEGYNIKRIAGITVGLPRGSLSPEEAALLPETIRRHFSFRLRDLDDDMRVFRREERMSILLAGINATIAIVFVAFFSGSLDRPIIFLLGGLITILNWVTVWHTYEYFVYDYRNEMRKRRIYRKIAGIDIGVEAW